ncbi:MAG: Ig-like domain-containing protein [Clostridiaceae bacterium]|nr:Ig-like domain-containing protein [Clostridiaceae bacterium]
MKRLQKLLSITFLVFFLCSLTAINANAATTFSDVSSHWSKDYVYKAVSHGYVDGYDDGTFKPNKAITRAEFCKMLNKALGLSATATTSFSDVTSSKWYSSDVQKAVAAGYISGYDDGTFLGDNQITRQEAALIIARLITDPSKSKDISSLSDSSSISSWALSGAKTVYSKGYMSGDEKKRFNPQGNLTRGEAVKIIESLLSTESITTTNLTVTSTGQTYSDKVYVGNVIISSSLGSGNVTFQNCKILGTMLVNGGGTSGIRLSNSSVSNMTINSSTAVGVAAVGTSTVSNTYISTGCTLTESNLSGTGKGFTDVTAGTGTSEITLAGEYNTVTVTAKRSLSLASGSISQLSVPSSAAGSDFNLSSGTTVATATINGVCSFKGSGKITKAIQNVKGVTYSVTPGTVTGSGTASTYVTVTTYPENGDKKVDTGANLTLMFSEAVSASNGTVLNSTYIQSGAVELRKGSQTGSKVAFYASVGGNARSATLTPLSSLSKDTEYFLIITAGAFKGSSGAYNTKQVIAFSTGTGKSEGLVPTVYPCDGADNVPIKPAITLEFSDKVYQSGGSALTSSYLKSVIELHKSSKSGTNISFSASISSDKKTITITPSSDLSTDTKYCIVLLDESIKSDADGLNEEQYFYFTTADTEYLVPAAYPSSGSTAVAADQEFKFIFEDALYNKDRGTLTSSYLEKTAFTFRKGSSSGTKVSFSASISSDKQTITITPDDDLTSATKYYISINEDTIMSSHYDYAPELTFTYQIGDDSSSSGTLTPSSTSPKNGKSGISQTTDITLTYSSAIYQSDGSAIDDDYIEDEAIVIRKGSTTGSKVSFSGDINSSKKVITLSPESKLSKDTKYYVMVNENVFKNASGDKNSKYAFSFTVGTSSSASGTLAPKSTSPEDDETGVSSDAQIQLTFGEAIYQSSGSSLTSTYLKNSVFEIRRGSSSGTKVSFSASISSTKKVVTLTPSLSLDEGYTYYVILKEESISNSSDDLNEEYTFSFKVNSSGSNTPSSVSPSNGATGIDINSQIQLTFPNTVYRSSSNSSLTTSHIASYVEIREGSSSSSATKIAFTPSVSSSGKVVTLTLNQYLKNSTKYYIYIPKNTFYNSAGTGNSSTLTYYFTTKAVTALTAPSMSPANQASGVSLSTDTIKLTYNESVLTSSSTAITDAYLQSNVKITTGSSSGTAVAFTGSCSSNVVSFKLTDPLLYDTKYYVTISSGAFKTSAGASSGSVSYWFETKKPSLSVTAVPGKTNATITVSYDYSGAQSASFKLICKGSSTITLKDGFIPNSDKGSFVQEVDELTEGGSYTVTAVLTYDGSKTLTETYSFKTLATSKDSSLSSLTVEDSEGTYIASLSSSSGGAATASVTGELKPSSGTLWITPTISDSHSTMEIDGKPFTSGSRYQLTVADGAETAQAAITVTAENGSTTTYTLTVSIYKEPEAPPAETPQP